MTALDPLLIDLYPGDHAVDWAAYVGAGAPWAGAILKASQCLRYGYLEWLTHQRNALRDAAGDRFGVDLFDGLYHYLDLAADGAAQADYFWAICEQSGGERGGTLPAMVDVERGGQSITNPSRAQVEDCTRAFAARYQVLSGRLPTLYGGELLRSVGVTSRLGCGRSAIALYGAEMPTRVIVQTGTDLGHLMLWQYRGSEPQTAGPAGYPLAAPGCSAAVDISAVVLPGGLAALRALAAATA